MQVYILVFYNFLHLFHLSLFVCILSPCLEDLRLFTALQSTSLHVLFVLFLLGMTMYIVVLTCQIALPKKNKME